MILLEQQDRSLWNRDEIAEGIIAHRECSCIAPFRRLYAAGCHCGTSRRGCTPALTDWRQIALLYDQLLRIQPSPVVKLNRAVAIAMSERLEQGLRLIDELLSRGELVDYHLAHSARADLCRRLGRLPETRASYERALALARREAERRFLARRLRELQ